MTHGKQLADVWTGTVAKVGAYWRGQKLVTTAVAAGGTTWKWTLPTHFPTGRYVRVTVTGCKLSQNGQPLVWSDHGYYEVPLDPGVLTISP